MSIYINNFIIVMLVGYFMRVHKTTKDSKKKIYLVFVVLLLGLTAGFRGLTVGYDTHAYELIYSRAADSWDQIFKNTQYVEIGFAVLCSLVKILGGSFQTLLIICSIFTIGCAAIFIYRHSENILLSLFILIAFPYYYHSFDIIRYFLAMSFVLLGYKYINLNEPLKFWAFVLCGSLFHSLVLVFSFLYFVPQIKWNKITISLTIVGTLVGMQFLDPLARLLAFAIGKSVDNEWVNQYAGGIKTMLMYGILAIMALFLYRFNNKEKSSIKAESMANILLLFAFSIVFIRAAMAIRLMLMFIPLMAVGFPSLMYGAKTYIQVQNNRIILCGLIVIGIIYHTFMMLENYQNIVPYVPYWK